MENGPSGGRDDSLDYLIDYQGRKCPVDTQNPWVTLRGEHAGNNYQRGSIVYPIGDTGKNPGYHHLAGHIVLSTLNTWIANFCGFEIGVSAISLADLIQKTGDKVGITLNDSNRQRIIGEISGNRKQVEAMLDEFIKQKIPEAVREEKSLSIILSRETTEYKSGIICDSLENVGEMLRAYEQGVAPKSNATQQQQLGDIEDVYGTEGVAFASSSGEGDNLSQFVEDMIAQIKASGGNWNHAYDCDEQGCFLKTNVTVKQRSDKFVLGIGAPRVGNEPEIQLAEAMGAERALIGKGEEYHLSTVGNTNWVGIDLEEILGGVLSAEQITKLAQISGGDIKEEYNHPYVVRIDNFPVILSIKLGQRGNYDSKTIRVGNKLFYESKKEGSDGEKHGNTYLYFSVKPGNDQPIVNPQLKDGFTSVQKKLSNAIQEKLSA